MALSLGWHIVLACFGVALPAMIYVAHRRYLKTGDEHALTLARRWAKVSAVLFALGAVSGTVLSFEMGLLWPGLMETYGDVIGLPFALEGVAFFLEAIFLGIYLYGWDRLPPEKHIRMLIPIAVSGVAGTFFIVAVNGWMNAPTGFRIVEGADGIEVVDVDPLAAMFNSALPLQFLHMLLAAYMVVGFLTASVYAVGMLRGRRDAYHRLGLLIPLTFAVIATPIQPIVGHFAGQRLADEQPIKLAAMEGLATTESEVKLELGGFYDGEELRGAITVPIPGLSSLLAQNSIDAEVIGLDAVPEDERPPVNIVRFSFQLMLGIGFSLVALAGVVAVSWVRRRRLPDSPWFLRAVVVAGPAAVVALETGWITTEVGRQPWIVHGVMRTTDAVTDAGWVWLSLSVIALLYLALTVAGYVVIRSMTRRWAAGETHLATPYGPERLSDPQPGELSS